MQFTHQMLVAINKEILDPRPYPFWRGSSKQMTMMPAKQSCRIMSIAFPAPNWLTLPYIPPVIVVKMPSNFGVQYLWRQQYINISLLQRYGGCNLLLYSRFNIIFHSKEYRNHAYVAFLKKKRMHSWLISISCILGHFSSKGRIINDEKTMEQHNSTKQHARMLVKSLRESKQWLHHLSSLFLSNEHHIYTSF